MPIIQCVRKDKRGQTDSVVVDIEMFYEDEWDKNERCYKWSADVRVIFKPVALLKEFAKDISSWEESKVEDLYKDIDDLRDIRMWFHEIYRVNSKIDRFWLNSPKTSAVCKEAWETIWKKAEDFAAKYNLEINLD